MPIKSQKQCVNYVVKYLSKTQTDGKTREKITKRLWGTSKGIRVKPKMVWHGTDIQDSLWPEFISLVDLYAISK
jgi:hypothetical protein